MRAAILILLSLLPLSGSETSQSTAIAGQERGSALADASELKPERWDEYSSATGRFRIRFPGAPLEEKLTNSTPGGEIEAHTLGYEGILTYKVISVDYRRTLDEPATATAMFRDLRMMVLRNFQAESTRILDEGQLKTDGHPSFFLHIRTDSGEEIRTQWVLAGTRYYTFTVGTRKARSGELTGEGEFKRLATAFADSFRVVP